MIEPGREITDPNLLPGSRGLRDPFAGQREVPISAPPPQISGGEIPSVYRSQLDAPPRVRLPGPALVAIAAHVVLLVAAMVLPKFFDRPQPLQKPIMVKQIQLGKPRDQKLMPRMDPPAAAPPPSPGVSIPPTPSKEAAPAKDPKPSPPRPKQPSREELMERALAQATKGVESDRHQIKPEEREGAENGSALGNSATAEEGDQYFTEVQQAILANYVLPSIISERERMSLKATVDAWIARDGTIVKYQFEQRSGNRFFDDALELAIKRTHVPPPPADRAAAIARDGVALVFTP